MSPQKTKTGVNCVQVSDTQAKAWLADDPRFLASLNDLDRGLIDEDEGVGPGIGEELTPTVAPPQQSAPRSAPVPPGPAAAPAADGAIGPSRSLDPARVSDIAPPVRPPTRAAPAAKAVVLARPVAPPIPVPRPPSGIPARAEDSVPPPQGFTRPSPSEPRARRPLLDLFPPSALEPEQSQPPALGTSVGPQLPPPRPRPAPEREAPSQPDAPTYETFYGLREEPFSLSTDPRFQYQSASHERAGQEILAAIRKRGGPTVVTGLPGMGKTLLCRSVVQEIDRRTVTSLVLEPLRSLDDLLTTMLVDFGVIARADLADAPRAAREVLTSTLNSFLDSLLPLQASAVVFIDEAQHIPVAVLGDLVALLGVPAARELQVVLVGQPALTTLLAHDDLSRLNSSVSRRTTLGPLAAQEISGYVMHRLSVAGADTRIEFDEAAIARLFELSGGTPRVVNLLCDRALMHGHALSTGVIGGALIDLAAADLDLAAPKDDGRGLLASLLIAALFALLVLAGATGALWTSRDAVSRTLEQWEQIPLPPAAPVLRLPLPIQPVALPDLTPDRQPDP